MPSDFETGAHDDLLDSPVKKMRKNKPPVEKFVVPRLNKVMMFRSNEFHVLYLSDNVCRNRSFRTRRAVGAVFKAC